MLVRRLGRGGNAEAWLGRHADGSEVALKTPEKHDPREEAYKRLKREVEIHERANRHPPWAWC